MGAVRESQSRLRRGFYVQISGWMGRRREDSKGFSVEEGAIDLSPRFLTLELDFYTLSVTTLGGLIFNADANRVEPDREAMISVPARS